ncbi:hypothetical protein BDY21DRAFT_345617 [Lineolata rhizophorae]|uniref:Uncharacterized protein n=1 Tax=Lineolata rhizophorae TaxID=578093 RepID=A0A6A6P008_9PEZI|nr:hypothetical protein BDY21DRAFT_345617 [Lineolata rhizophorae]
MFLSLFHKHHKQGIFTFTLLSFLITPALGSTIVSSGSECTIQGDPDVFGIGVRVSLYLQWGSSIIFLAFSPEQASIPRTTMAATTAALYINTFVAAAHGNLIAIEWLVLFYLTFSLSLLNLPVSRAGLQKHGGTIALMSFLWGIYYVVSPWMFFKGLDIAKEPGCDVKIVIFVPISIYAHGFRTAFKVLSIFDAILLGIANFGLAVYLFVRWIQGWADREVQENIDKPGLRGRILATFQVISGVIAIIFAERTLSVNHVTFPGVAINNSGQLIPFILGLFALVASIFSALKTFSRSHVQGAT